ncbi:unnamed protein product [Rhizoctonia solani]|uniref:Uncharacterized protein n=1 Tax=Rhizoctonia solani TaxID=456999 RepID=A0A8H3AJ63_9AGAM|nr:unnamed protein product [Rhizoctonia solani]
MVNFITHSTLWDNMVPFYPRITVENKWLEKCCGGGDKSVKRHEPGFVISALDNAIAPLSDAAIHIASVAAPSQTTQDLAPGLVHHASALDVDSPTTLHFPRIPP